MKKQALRIELAILAFLAKHNSYGFFSIEASVINETSKAQLKDHGFLILFALEFDVLGRQAKWHDRQEVNGSFQCKKKGKERRAEVDAVCVVIEGKGADAILSTCVIINVLIGHFL